MWAHRDERLRPADQHTRQRQPASSPPDSSTDCARIPRAAGPGGHQVGRRSPSPAGVRASPRPPPFRRNWVSGPGTRSRAPGQLAGGRRDGSSAPSSTVPWSGRRRPTSSRPSVDLPLPFGPTSAIRSARPATRSSRAGSVCGRIRSGGHAPRSGRPVGLAGSPTGPGRGPFGQPDPLAAHAHAGPHQDLVRTPKVDRPAFAVERQDEVRSGQARSTHARRGRWTFAPGLIAAAAQRSRPSRPVQVRGRFVQHQDAGQGREYPTERDTLLLAAREAGGPSALEVPRPTSSAPPAPGRASDAGQPRFSRPNATSSSTRSMTSGSLDPGRRFRHVPTARRLPRPGLGPVDLERAPECRRSPAARGRRSRVRACSCRNRTDRRSAASDPHPPRTKRPTAQGGSHRHGRTRSRARSTGPLFTQNRRSGELSTPAWRRERRQHRPAGHDDRRRDRHRDAADELHDRFDLGEIERPVMDRRPQRSQPQCRQASGTHTTGRSEREDELGGRTLDEPRQEHVRPHGLPSGADTPATVISAKIAAPRLRTISGASTAGISHTA